MSDPWATPEVRRTDPRPVAPRGAFARGVAQVGVSRPRFDDTTPALEPPVGYWRDDARVPVRPQLRQLRVGGEWTTIGAMFAFVCWGIWAISARGSDMGALTISLFLVLLIAAGLFTLLRLLGRVVLERSLGLTRRGARGSHLATALFLVAAGIAYLGQTRWVVDAWTWLKAQFW